MRKTFEQQIATNKRNSVILVVAMFVLLTILGSLVGYMFEDVVLGTVISVGATMLIVLISWNCGANMLLSFSNASEIEKADSPQLFNVVEEMSIAAGVPMPKVFVINSDAPNAFATGIDPEHAAVAITTGLMDKLNREEIQGVMAHEIGHIRNYDIRLSMLMSVLAGGVVILSDILMHSMIWGGTRRRSNNNNDNVGLQIAMVLIGLFFAILAPLFANLIQLASSRQREYLADASAVEFTRNPSGLASALAKISGDQSPMESSKATAHLYVVNPKLGLRGGADSWFSTHPPITERIAKLREFAGQS